MKLLLFLATLCGLLSIAPLITWAVTGRADRAWEAARQYWGILGAMFLLVGILAGLTYLPMLWS